MCVCVCVCVCVYKVCSCGYQAFEGIGLTRHSKAGAGAVEPLLLLI